MQELDEKDHCLVFDFGTEAAADLQDAAFLTATLRKSLEEAGIDVFHTLHHKFTGGGEGVTAVCIIGASCADIHTWPEHGTMVLRCFACGDKEQSVQEFFGSMIGHLLPRKVYEVQGRTIRTAIPDEIPSSWRLMHEIKQSRH